MSARQHVTDRGSWSQVATDRIFAARHAETRDERAERIARQHTALNSKSAGVRDD